MESKAMQKMIKARAALIITQRFFGSLALRLQLKEDASCDTMWTDGISLGFNPDWTNNLTMDDTRFWELHEVGHCVLNHHIRRGNRDATDWNIACDYAVNNLLKKSGLTVPNSALHSPDFDNKSVEEIYTILQGRKPKQQDDGNGTGNGQNSPSQGQQQQQQGQSKGNNTNPPQNGPGEVRDYPGPDGQGATESEKQQHQQDWQIATAQAAQTAEGCGQMSGSLKELVKDMLEPKVPWREVLQRFVDQISHNDYTYTRTNPRYAAFGIIMPSLYNKELPPMDVYFDTSGSMTKKDKQESVCELNDIRGHYNVTLRLVFVDTQVRHIQTITPDMPPITELEFYGGGGTKFKPAFDWSAKQEDSPCCGVYFTDMENGNEKIDTPQFPVLWINTRGTYKGSIPFGELINMKPNHY